MYPANLAQAALSQPGCINVASHFSRHGSCGAGSAPANHSLFWGRWVDYYEGHAAWRPAAAEDDPHHPDCPANDGFGCHCDELGAEDDDRDYRFAPVNGVGYRD